MTPTTTETARRAPLLHLSHPDHHIPGYELPEAASRPPTRKACMIGFLIATAIALLGALLHHLGENAPTPDVPLVSLVPFITLLTAIALLPFIANGFWEKHYHQVSIALGLLVVAYYFLALHAQQVMAETLSDYISFIFLLGSLFVVSGGVIIRIHRSPTPAANVAILLIGSLLANIFGTTGAAMLLIRPYLRLNKQRPRGVRPYHIVFFIFSVANIGGAFTPIGDPPLFLGYLKGVPFWWVAQHSWPCAVTAIGLLCGIFFIIDSLHYRGQRRTGGVPAERIDAGAKGSEGASVREMVSIFGAANILFITLILLGVFLEAPWREILMAGAAFGSLATTSPRIHGENHFNYAPIKEVAFLFLGIFATMVPAMNYLHSHANDPFFQRNLHTPGQFYFASGTLSAVLDSAPTYATFLESAIGKLPPQQLLAGKSPIALLLDDARLLIAISMGTVFFGACTYIGNGPNFMVKSIAEHAGVKTPSFFAYILCFTLPILMPVLILCWAVFLR